MSSIFVLEISKYRSRSEYLINLMADVGVFERFRLSKKVTLEIGARSSIAVWLISKNLRSLNSESGRRCLI